MAVQAMMTCSEVTTRGAPYTTTRSIDDEEVQARTREVKLHAVYDEDPDSPNHEWALWTPAGTVELTINGDEAGRYFEPGADYRVTFTKRQPQQAR